LTLVSGEYCCRKDELAAIILWWQATCRQSAQRDRDHAGVVGPIEFFTEAPLGPARGSQPGAQTGRHALERQGK